MDLTFKPHMWQNYRILYPFVLSWLLYCRLAVLNLVENQQKKKFQRYSLAVVHWLIFNQLHPLIMMPPAMDVVLRGAKECPAEAQGLIPSFVSQPASWVISGLSECLPLCVAPQNRGALTCRPRCNCLCLTRFGSNPAENQPWESVAFSFRPCRTCAYTCRALGCASTMSCTVHCRSLSVKTALSVTQPPALLAFCLRATWALTDTVQVSFTVRWSLNYHKGHIQWGIM